MSVEANITTTHRFIEEALNKGNMAVLSEVTAPNYRYHGSSGRQLSGDEYQQYFSTVVSAFNDFHVVVEDEIIGRGNFVAYRVKWTGTHTGELMGIPSTGKKVTIKQAYFLRFEGDKVAEAWNYDDPSALFQQLGISPPGQ